MIRFVASLIPLVLLGGLNEVSAQEDVYCAPVQERFEDAYRRSRPQPVRPTTQEVLDGITVNELMNTLDDPVGARNGFLDRDPPVRTKDQRLVVRRMEAVYCQIVFSRSDLDEESKLAQFNRLVRVVYSAEPFEPVATTRESPQASRQYRPLRLDARHAFLRHAAFAASGSILFAVAASEQEPETEFLAEAPYFVNNTNKYFVIIASAPSHEQGLRMMRSLKQVAPEYDFALYPPYRDNPNYAVMSATWVSKDIAKDAQTASLQVARRWLGDNFSPQRDTPFIWCYPYGSCR